MNKKKIALIGLGYVGLPLAVEFGRHRDVIGYDIDEERINELIDGVDSTLETSSEELEQAIHLSYSTNIEDIKDCNIYIITVPTPIDSLKKPDLSFLEKSSALVGNIIKPGDIIIYESTVFPGATEEICVPILEKNSNLVFNEDFFCGYSPERINPGDKLHRLPNIKKVTSGSNPRIADEIDELYQEIIIAGTHKASSIKVAEAAKIIENTQRDVNIALINELALIFNKLNIDTESVLEAAATKWNFLPFKPGLVGGHCIGVDPYYLTHKAIEVGYKPEMILAGRRLNDNMGSYIADQVSSLMRKNLIDIPGSDILIMGFTFKENCPDIRNTRVIDIVSSLKSLNTNVSIYDPWVDLKRAKKEYNLDLLETIENKKYDAIILAVAHKDFQKLSLSKIKSLGKEKHIIYDIKHLFRREEVDGRL